MARVRYITLSVSNFIVDKFKNILHVYLNTLIIEKKNGDYTGQKHPGHCDGGNPNYYDGFSWLVLEQHECYASQSTHTTDHGNQ